MTVISEILDKDWDRLSALCNNISRKRRVSHAFSPRFAPVVLIRIAQWLHIIGWIRLAKIPALINFFAFGLEVPPRLKIGPGLVVMHTQGTVLGANSIGENFTVYHQVTLGAKEMVFLYTPTLHPIVGDNVTIGVGAKVLVGLTLGDGSMVGANAVVLEDVPPGHVAVGIPAKNLSPKTERLDSVSMELNG